MLNSKPTEKKTADPLVIEPPSAWWKLNLEEMWSFRDMLFFLIWRNVLVRYKQTVMGFAWVIVQPLLAATVFALLFSRAGGLPTDGYPPILFYFSGLVIWTCFSSGLTMASTSLSTDSNLIRKIYFPRLILPITASVTSWVDFCVSCLSLGVMIGVLYEFSFHAIWALPFFLALSTLTAFSVSLWLSALDVQFHDIRYTIPFLIQIWMFLSPVILSASEISSRLGLSAWAYGLNPMSTAVSGFRWSLNLGDAPSAGMIASSCTVSIVLFFSGLWYFKRTENFFADVI